MKGTIKIMAYDYPEFIKGREEHFIKEIVHYIKKNLDFMLEEYEVKDINYDELEVEFSLGNDDEEEITEIQDELHDIVWEAIRTVIADYCIFLRCYAEDCPPFGRTIEPTIKAPKVRYYIQWEV